MDRERAGNFPESGQFLQKSLRLQSGQSLPKSLGCARGEERETLQTLSGGLRVSGLGFWVPDFVIWGPLVLYNDLEKRAMVHYEV